MEGALQGVKVLEVSAWAFVPSAGAVLADWGADVVKVEPPNGDPLRGLVTGGITGGPSFPWEIWNRGKRSIAVDLRNPDGRDVVLALAEQADVFLTSYLPSTRANLGIDIDDVRARNPRIVYACGSGHGPKGDQADRGGYDSITFWARGGVCSVVTPPGAERPIGQPVGAFGDSLSGMALAGGVAAALLKRERTGEGAVVDVSLLSTAMWCMQMSVTGAAMVMALAERNPDAAGGGIGNPTMSNPLVNNYRTSDGRWVALCMLQRDVYWEGLLDAIGRSELKDDPRFADPEALSANTAAAVEELQTTFATRTLEEWRAILETQPGQWDVVQNVFELPKDPQAIANGYVQTVSYEGGFDLPVIAAPAQVDRTPPELGTAPEFNQHAEEVLLGLGMDWERIIALKESGAIA